MKTIKLDITPQELASIVEGHIERTILKVGQRARVTQLSTWSPPLEASSITTLYHGAQVTVQIVSDDKP